MVALSGLATANLHKPTLLLWNALDIIHCLNADQLLAAFTKYGYTYKTWNILLPQMSCTGEKFHICRRLLADISDQHAKRTQ